MIEAIIEFFGNVVEFFAWIICELCEALWGLIKRYPLVAAKIFGGIAFIWFVIWLLNKLFEMLGNAVAAIGL